MKNFNFEAWFRCKDEKDFWEGSVEATDIESAEEKIRNKDRRVFKIIFK